MGNDQQWEDESVSDKADQLSNLYVCGKDGKFSYLHGNRPSLHLCYGICNAIFWRGTSRTAYGLVLHLAVYGIYHYGKFIYDHRTHYILGRKCLVTSG